LFKCVFFNRPRKRTKGNQRPHQQKEKINTHLNALPNPLIATLIFRVYRSVQPHWKITAASVQYRETNQPNMNRNISLRQRFASQLFKVRLQRKWYGLFSRCFVRSTFTTTWHAQLQKPHSKTIHRIQRTATRVGDCPLYPYNEPKKARVRAYKVLVRPDLELNTTLINDTIRAGLSFNCFQCTFRRCTTVRFGSGPYLHDWNAQLQKTWKLCFAHADVLQTARQT